MNNNILEIDEIISNEYDDIIKTMKNIIFKKDEYDIPIYKSKIHRKIVKKILVLSGGGVKGIAHVGAFKALEEKGYLDKIEIFAGTSVGCLIIILYIIGYSPLELYEFIERFDFTKLQTFEFTKLINNYGLDDGKRFEYFLKKMFLEKSLDPMITFEELYKLKKKKIIITCVCVNDMSVHYMSHDTYPKTSVIVAIMMSCSIPIISMPVKYDNKLWADGGCMDNYPIHLFNDRLNETIGIYFDANKEYKNEINNLEEYFSQIFNCFYFGYNVKITEHYDQYTVHINIPKISPIHYSLDKNQKQILFQKGYEAVLSFLSRS